MTPFDERPSFSMTITATAGPDRRIGPRPGDAGLPAPSNSNVVPLPGSGVNLRALLPPSVRRAVSASTNYTTGQWGFEPVGGFDLVGPVDPRELVEARTTVAEALRPGGFAVAERELTRLRMVTIKSRDAEAIDIATAATAYAEVLAEYPEDIVVAVCRGWPRRGGKFWPALAELLDEAERLVAERRRLQDALVRGPKPVEADPEDEWRRRAIAVRNRQWAEAAAWRRAHPELVACPTDVRRPGSWRPLPNLVSELADFSARFAAERTKAEDAL